MMTEDSKYSDIVVNKFTEESAKAFRDKVLRRSSIDPNMPVIIYVDSYGGNVDALNTMISTMHQIPNPTVTVCIGKAMSCGAILLAAGDYRFCDPMARVLIHEVTAGSINPINDMENDVKECRRLNNQMMNFLAKRCNKTYKQIKDMMHAQDSRDINLTAKEALDFGIVDHIGTPIVKPIIMYSIDSVPEHNYSKDGIAVIKEVVITNSRTKTKTKKKKTRRKTR